MRQRILSAQALHLAGVARPNLFERVFQRQEAVEAGTLKLRLGVAPGASARCA